MRIALAIVLAVTSTGCPFGDDDGDPGNWVVIDQMEAAYRTAYCTYLVRCGQFPDQATCEGAAIPLAMQVDPNIVAAANAGRVSYSGSSVKACFAALANNTCDRTDQNGRMRVAACEGFFRGTRMSNQPCFVDQECISQNCVGGSTGTTCSMGQCVGDIAPTVSPANVGEPCSGLFGCVDGAFCDTSLDICTALKPAGQTCISADECAYGLGCSGTTGARTCKALPTVGQPCPEALCRDDGNVCTGAVCVQVGLPPTACTSSTQCSSFYPCDFTTSMCKQGPALGQPCSSTNRCFAAGTFCDTTTTLTCVAVRAEGMPCTADMQCQSGHCDFAIGLCQAPVTCTF
ncbi:MAG TPA: Dickkopf N-terminal cysteine-rich domain-containing protein [Kofleriaceae bacterium]